jgi:hypothetical protein
MEFRRIKSQQGIIRVAETDFARKLGDFSMVGGNVGGGVAIDVVYSASNHTTTTILLGLPAYL